MKPALSILCTGSEILDGRIEDTNSRYLISVFEELGISVHQVLACRDDIATIRDSISYLLTESQVLIVTGGLGPTSDDVTREAVAAYIGKPLYLDSGALAELKELYQRRKRNFDASNSQQAQFPEGSTILKNPVGTAAGFHSVKGNGKGAKHVLVFPGVPHELKRMCSDHVVPFVKQHFGIIPPPRAAYLHIFGRPESKVGELVESAGIPEGINISYRAHYPEIIVKIYSEKPNASVEQFAAAAKQRIGSDFVFSEHAEESFDHAMHNLLTDKKQTVAVAESCTGGMLGSLLTTNPGASNYFLGGAITYSNQAKIKVLDVPGGLIEAKGAVSKEVAQYMAANARQLFSSDLAVSITGIAGPDGGSAAKPVGTFYVGFASRDGTQAFYCFASASRTMLRTFASYTALDIVRRYLLGFELRPADIIGAPQDTTKVIPT